jgi:hypothetical protein
MEGCRIRESAAQEEWTESLWPAHSGWWTACLRQLWPPMGAKYPHLAPTGAWKVPSGRCWRGWRTRWVADREGLAGVGRAVVPFLSSFPPALPSRLCAVAPAHCPRPARPLPTPPPPPPLLPPTTPCLCVPLLWTQVPVLDEDALRIRALRPNTLVRFRGMVQNTLEPEYYSEAMVEVTPTGVCMQRGGSHALCCLPWGVGVGNAGVRRVRGGRGFHRFHGKCAPSWAAPLWATPPHGPEHVVGVGTACAPHLGARH